jgi:hypothetical protein
MQPSTTPALLSVLLPNSIQHPLGTPDLTLPLLHHRGSMPNRDSQRLKRTLRPMMIILSPQTIDMQRRPTRLRKALQTMRNHLAAQIANLLPPQPQINHTIRPVRQINHSPRQRLVQRRIRVPKAREPRRPVQRRLERRANGQKGVFGRVVVVNVEVAFASDAQAPAGVFGEGVDHVVEEADACVDGDFLACRGLRGMVFVDFFAFAVEVLLVEARPEVGFGVGVEGAAVEVERDLDFGLVGVAVERGGAWHCGGGFAALLCVFWCRYGLGLGR